MYQSIAIAIYFLRHQTHMHSCMMNIKCLTVVIYLSLSLSYSFFATYIKLILKMSFPINIFIERAFCKNSKRKARTFKSIKNALTQ